MVTPEKLTLGYITITVDTTVPPVFFFIPPSGSHAKHWKGSHAKHWKPCTVFRSPGREGDSSRGLKVERWRVAKGLSVSLHYTGCQRWLIMINHITQLWPVITMSHYKPSTNACGNMVSAVTYGEPALCYRHMK